MHEHADGSITYTFPNEPHPQLAFKDTSNKGALGLKAMTEDAMTDALAMAG